MLSDVMLNVVTMKFIMLRVVPPLVIIRLVLPQIV
jgi:hypothetical protein